MSDKDWAPNNLDKSQTLGGLGAPHENARNTLQRSNNRAVHLLGDFCQNTPSDMDVGMATFGGLLIGLRIGQRFNGPTLDAMMEEILSLGKTRMGPEFLDRVIDFIMSDPRGNDLVN